MKAIEEAKEHILAGDIFQIVLSQRFERRTFADPYEIYRALRIVNPSPYMIYLQARGCVLVASSPEILCRITGVSISRPLSLLCFSLASFTFWCILLGYISMCLGQECVVP
jgi:anthranilate synthase component 1